MSQNIEILEKQEELLQFDHFNHEDAYALGTFMVDYAKKHNITIAVSIRMNNGCIVFQHCPDGTNLLNQKWMERKFNSVKLMERSSLLTNRIWKRDGDTVEKHGLENNEYATFGGGFPVRIKGTGAVIGVILASNLPHLEDHGFIINCLKEFLNCPEAPDYPCTDPK